MPWHVKDGGTWREVSDPQVRVSGAWQEVQEGWVRVSGTWEQFFQRAFLNADLGVGNVSTTYGFEAVAPLGSLSPDTYLDGGSNSRQVVMAQWGTASNTVNYRIAGTSVPNTDTTFYGIEIDGQGVLLRSSASYTADTGAGSTDWSWSTDVSGYPTSGTVTFLVLGP